MRNGIRWIGRIHLRIERGDFHRKIYNRKKPRIFFGWMGPAPRFPGEAIKQIKTALSILVSFLFAHDGFPQKIDGETDFSCAALARSEEHTPELQSLTNLVSRLLLEKTK